MSLDAFFLLDLVFFGVDEFVAVADGDLAVFVVPDCAIVSEAENQLTRLGPHDHRLDDDAFDARIGIRRAAQCGIRKHEVIAAFGRSSSMDAISGSPSTRSPLNSTTAFATFFFDADS